MGKNILLVDDEPEIADLMEVYLSNEDYQVYKFYCAEDALECLERVPMDLALLDVMLPDMNGFTLCKRIREKWYFPIIMLTAKIADADKIMGITLGADDYITKPFNPMEVTARVRAQLRRVEKYNPSMHRREEGERYDIRGLELDVGTHICKLYGREVRLTPLEFSILLYLCRHQGQVVTAEELFENVWGEKYLDCNNTVMAHIAKIREKLQENARKPKFIRTVWGVGYRIDE